MFLLYLWSCLSRKVFPIFILQKMIKINMPDCFFRKEFKPFCKVLSVTKVYRLPIDSLLICKHLRAKNPAILKVGIPLYKIPFLFYFHLNSKLFQCFVHPIFCFFGFWYFGHYSCVVFFPFFLSCPSCLAKCKQRLHNIFKFS